MAPIAYRLIWGYSLLSSQKIIFQKSEAQLHYAFRPQLVIVAMLLCYLDFDYLIGWFLNVNYVINCVEYLDNLYLEIF
jgi:hypothetical protein